jgi:hypothetical protein
MDVEFSLNSSGWLAVFQLGVVKLLQDTVDLSSARIVGTSAGAAAGAVICCNFPAEVAAEAMCQQEILSRCDFTKMVPLMKEGLERLAPEGAADACNGRLGIVCTEVQVFPPKISTVEFKTYASRKDLVELLGATSHIPVLGGFAPHLYRGRWLYDGLFTLPHARVHDKDVFKISKMAWCECGCTNESHARLFCPAVHFPQRWSVFPPNDKVLRLIFYHGYTQARQVLRRHDFPRHLFKFKPAAADILADCSTASDIHRLSSDIHRLSSDPLENCAEAVCNEDLIRAHLQVGFK